MTMSLIFGHRDGGDRMANLLALLEYYKDFGYEIIVVEQDYEKKSNFPEYINHYFAYNPGLYNRSWGFNIGASKSSCPVLFCIDSDMLVPGEVLAESYDAIVGGSMVHKPYSRFLCLPRSITLKMRERIDFGQCGAGLLERTPEYDWLVAGCVAVQKRFYVDSGGFNEGFRGWGGEDDEFIRRVRKMSDKVTRDNVGLCVYHMNHERYALDTAAQPGYRENLRLLGETEAAGLDRILDIVYKLREDFGNMGKYSGEKRWQ